MLSPILWRAAKTTKHLKRILNKLGFVSKHDKTKVMMFNTTQAWVTTRSELEFFLGEASLIPEYVFNDSILK